MKHTFSLFALAALALTMFPGHDAEAAALGGTRFAKTIYLSGAVTTTSKSAANSGRDYASAKALLDGDLMDIPANVVIDNVYAIADVAVTGLTAFNLGDDDASSGFVVSASSPLAAAGLSYWHLTDKGAYMKSGNFALAKLYSATGKKLKLDVTGTAGAASRVRVIVTGYASGL